MFIHLCKFPSQTSDVLQLHQVHFRMSQLHESCRIWILCSQNTLHVLRTVFYNVASEVVVNQQERWEGMGVRWKGGWGRWEGTGLLSNHNNKKHFNNSLSPSQYDSQSMSILILSGISGEEKKGKEEGGGVGVGGMDQEEKKEEIRRDMHCRLEATPPPTHPPSLHLCSPPLLTGDRHITFDVVLRPSYWGQYFQTRSLKFTDFNGSWHLTTEEHVFFFLLNIQCLINQPVTSKWITDILNTTRWDHLCFKWQVSQALEELKGCLPAKINCFAVREHWKTTVIKEGYISRRIDLSKVLKYSSHKSCWTVKFKVY